MTKEQAQNIPDLCIEVTPLVEDAFFGFRQIDDLALQEKLKTIPDGYAIGDGDKETDALVEKYVNDVKAALNAIDRLKTADSKERAKAINTASRMMKNIQKYGIACAEWAKD